MILFFLIKKKRRNGQRKKLWTQFTVVFVFLVSSGVHEVVAWFNALKHGGNIMTIILGLTGNYIDHSCMSPEIKPSHNWQVIIIIIPGVIIITHLNTSFVFSFKHVTHMAENLHQAWFNDQNKILGMHACMHASNYYYYLKN